MSTPTLSNIVVGRDGVTFTFTFASTPPSTGFTLTSGITGFSAQQWTSNIYDGQAPFTLNFNSCSSSGLVVTGKINNGVVGYSDNIQVSYIPGNLTDNLGGSVAGFGPISVVIPPGSTPLSLPPSPDAQDGRLQPHPHYFNN